MVDEMKALDAYLKICQVAGRDQVYTIGPFFRSGVTLLKQQIRALNLVYALTSSPNPATRERQHARCHRRGRGRGYSRSSSGIAWPRGLPV